MKSTTRIIKVIGITLLIGCAAARAESWSDNLYLHADIGPAFVPNTTTKAIGVFGGSFFASQGRLEFDPGIRGDLSLGYNLTKSWAVELEAGAVWNPIQSSENSFYQVPIMFKTRYQVSLNKSWKVYFGAGAGEVIGIFEGEFLDPNFHVPLRISDMNTAFGYEAEAGIKYNLSRRFEIDLGYRFLGVNEYDWNFQRRFAYTVNLRTDDIFTHSAQLSLTWKF